LDRFHAGRVGFCWTDNREVAEMYASGLNATVSGGVLLRCEVEPEVIISAPSEHSQYLGEFEYTVNPVALTQIQVLQEYQSVD